jgi:membrane-bound ClpP family serine protease
MDSLLIIGIGCLALGLLLLILEAFVPSGGILGLLAFVSAIVGIVFLFKFEAIWGAIGLLGTVILGPMMFFGALNMLPSTKLGRVMVGSSGEEIALARAETVRVQRDEREHLMGLEGTAATDMRPSGVVLIEGQRHDAISKGGVIDRGEPIRVVAIDGLTIEVRQA